MYNQRKELNYCEVVTELFMRRVTAGAKVFMRRVTAGAKIFFLKNQVGIMDHLL
ncbi:hypothetical protein IW492_10100 [Enterococcus sp. BWB1-3]|nr:hypothetical protein [Enterococcus sp. BWB1-3]